MAQHAQLRSAWHESTAHRLRAAVATPAFTSIEVDDARAEMLEEEWAGAIETALENGQFARSSVRLLDPLPLLSYSSSSAAPSASSASSSSPFSSGDAAAAAAPKLGKGGGKAGAAAGSNGAASANVPWAGVWSLPEIVIRTYNDVTMNRGGSGGGGGGGGVGRKGGGSVAGRCYQELALADEVGRSLDVLVDHVEWWLHPKGDKRATTSDDRVGTLGDPPLGDTLYTGTGLDGSLRSTDRWRALCSMLDSHKDDDGPGSKKDQKVATHEALNKIIRHYTWERYRAGLNAADMNEGGGGSDGGGATTRGRALGVPAASGPAGGSLLGTEVLTCDERHALTERVQDELRSQVHDTVAAFNESVAAAGGDATVDVAAGGGVHIGLEGRGGRADDGANRREGAMAGMMGEGDVNMISERMAQGLVRNVEHAVHGEAATRADLFDRIPPSSLYTATPPLSHHIAVALTEIRKKAFGPDGSFDNAASYAVYRKRQQKDYSKDALKGIVRDSRTEGVTMSAFMEVFLDTIEGCLSPQEYRRGVNVNMDLNLTTEAGNVDRLDTNASSQLMMDDGDIRSLMVSHPDIARSLIKEQAADVLARFKRRSSHRLSAARDADQATVCRQNAFRDMLASVAPGGAVGEEGYGGNAAGGSAGEGSLGWMQRFYSIVVEALPVFAADDVTDASAGKGRGSKGKGNGMGKGAGNLKGKGGGNSDSKGWGGGERGAVLCELHCGKRGNGQRAATSQHDGWMRRRLTRMAGARGGAS
jgi:hypothetical protein